MASIKFENGDIFDFPNGSGIVLPSGKALIIEGAGGCTGYTVRKDVIPEGASGPSRVQNFEVKFALNAVAVAMKEG